MVKSKILAKNMAKIQTDDELRLIHKQLRRNMPIEEKISQANEVCNNVLALLESDFKGADIFLCFYPLGDEINLIPLYKQLLDRGCKLYFPISDTESYRLYFHLISDLTNDFKNGSYGIMEPKANLPILNSTDNPAIAITPGLVFDKACNRLGYGAGYYDRFFSANPSTIRIAPCFLNQLEDHINTSSHDVPMDFIVTADGIMRGNRL